MMYSSAPREKPCSSSSSSPLAVSMITGTWDLARMRRQTSQPSIRGIITSSSTRSGGSAANFSSASTPSAASAVSYPLIRR